jgi:hypothetical protein
MRAAESAAHSNLCNNFHDCLMSARSCRYSAIASRVYAPCRNAFRLPRGAPEPAAPPCILHRRFPRTAGDLQGRPDLVLAPQRGLESIGPVLRRWLAVIVSSALRFFCARYGNGNPFFGLFDFRHLDHFCVGKEWLWRLSLLCRRRLLIVCHAANDGLTALVD